MKQYLINNKTCVGYCRLSVEDKDKAKSNSIESQIKLIEKYCVDHNLNLIDIYIDDGYSGSNFSRPSFKTMLTDLKNKKFDCIITKDLSRLGRNYIEVGKYLDDIFAKNCIRYISIGDQYDSSLNDDDSIIINNICNALYLKDCRKKAIQTFDRKAVKCDLFVRKYGYKFNDQHQVIIDEEVYPILRLIMNSYLELKSLQKVVDMLKKNKALTRKEYHLKKKGILINPTYKWDTAMVSSILKDYEYCGHAINMPKRKNNQGKIVVNNDVIIMKNVRPSIFTETEFFKAKEIAKLNPTYHINKNNDHLTKKVYLKDNGRTMTYVPPRDSFHHGKYKNKETGKTIYSDELHQLLYKDIKHMIECALGGKDKLFKYLLSKYQNQENDHYLEELIREKEKIESLFQKHFEDKLEGLISEIEYKEKTEELYTLNNHLETQINQIKKSKSDQRLIHHQTNLIYSKIMKIKDTYQVIDVINEFIKKVIVEVETKRKFYIEIIYY